MSGTFRTSSAPPHAQPVPHVQPPLSLWTVYERPSDFPTEYVARQWLVDGERDAPKHTGKVVRAAALEDIRNAMRERGLFRIKRFDSDDPVIVEVWI